jgi:DNA-binding response OmpR family regulator
LLTSDVSLLFHLWFVTVQRSIDEAANLRNLNILLIEDNVAIARQLLEFLADHGWQVDYADTGGLGLKLVDANIYDVVILDLNLPDMDGLNVCAHIKQSGEINTPVLMLTARDAFEDKAQGFGQGADDYVTKPFEFRELALRCQALARRNDLHRSKQLHVGELRIDLAQNIASRDDQRLVLTAIGFRILVQIAQAYPNPISRSRLLHQIWGDSPPESDALKSHIFSLRSALDKPFATPMLSTITNVGYKLVLPDD